MKYILIFLLLFSCQRKHDNEAHIERDELTQLSEKKKLYCEKSREAVAERGWAVGECDGLLFTGLRGIGCDDVDLYVFESAIEPGRWYRDPKHDCFVSNRIENGSDSTISKDMYIGLIANLVWRGDTDALKRTYEYAYDHDWVIGEADDPEVFLGKCILTPNLQFTLKDAAYGGNNNIFIDEDFTLASGFRAHLDVLHILIDGKIHGGITDGELSTLKGYARKQPNNALFQAAKAKYDDGDFAIAKNLLLDKTHWPDDRLPNNHDEHCSPYIFERDFDAKDWEPCKNEPYKVHDGTDFVFAVAVLQGLF